MAVFGSLLELQVLQPANESRGKLKYYIVSGRSNKKLIAELVDER